MLCQRDVIASSDWLFRFTVLFSLAEKKMRFREKKWCNLGIKHTAVSHHIARITSDFKMDLNHDNNDNFLGTFLSIKTIILNEIKA